MEKEEVELNAIQWAILKLFGFVKVGREQREGWSAPIQMYVVECRKHGLYRDYRHGYDNHFNCMKCWEEAKC